ncbi:MAG: accessory Sec system protein Asp1, partial [Candidatus Weimeria sp.]
MQYFIPAWYQDNDWKRDEQFWYRSRKVTEFDDTVKQIQLFFRKHVAPFEILVLGYFPDFRHFLHRQGVFHAPYWSCFDAMQGISAKQMKPFSFHDLSWPDDIEFIYSPFAVIVKRKNEKYAQIEFAEDGNMFRVDQYKNGRIYCRNNYDDRGFMSSQIVFQNGREYREQYFDEDGVWKFARFADDGHVVINPKNNWYYSSLNGTKEKVSYSKASYSGIAEVIEEVLSENLRNNPDSDIFIAAMHPLHSRVLADTIGAKKLVLSFFARRLEENGINEDDEKLIRRADYIVVDQKDTEKTLWKCSAASGKKIREITPYDSREETSDSLKLHVQNVLLSTDQMELEDYNRVIVL